MFCVYILYIDYQKVFGFKNCVFSYYIPGFLFARFSCSFTDCKSPKTESLAAKDLENSVANDCYKDSFIPDMQNGIQTKSALNGLNVEEEIKKTEPSLEIANNCDHQGILLARSGVNLHIFFLEILILGFKNEKWCLPVA